MRKTGLMVAMLVMGPPIWWAPAATAETVQTEVPQQVRSLVGTYTGTWELFGINDKGAVTRKMAWTDVVEASGAKVVANEAFVSTSMVMTFRGGHVPPYTMTGREGYVLNADGTPNTYFIETGGARHRMVKVGDNVWSYTAQAHAGELARLGFPSNATGQHVLVKVVSQEQGRETHRINRMTVVKWKTRDGKDKVLTFTSLKGMHERKT